MCIFREFLPLKLFWWASRFSEGASDLKSLWTTVILFCVCGTYKVESVKCHPINESAEQLLSNQPIVSHIDTSHYIFWIVVSHFSI